MKTKQILFTLFLIVTFHYSYSQYNQLLNNSSWNVEISGQLGSEFVLIEPGIDVIIGSFTYKKFIDIDFDQTEILLREDIVSKKVYRRINNSDVLLFDFSLQVGSNITLGNGFTYTVTNISNINVTDGQRKMFSLSTPSGPPNERWIEGVGNWDHPLKPKFELPSDPSYNIACSYQNNVNIFNFGLANGNTPTTCPTLSVKDFNSITQNINVSPNPFSTEATIRFENSLENITIELYNSIGQIVRKTQSANSKEIIINRENLVNGLYFLKLIQNNNLLETKKIIIIN